MSIHHFLYRQDAFVLGRLLAHESTHLGNVADALKMYEEVRLPFANSIVQQSQDVGRYYSFQLVSADGSVPPHNSPEELNFVRKAIEDAWGWQSGTTWVGDGIEERWRARCGMRAKL